jgi:hypothetical protein
VKQVNKGRTRSIRILVVWATVGVLFSLPLALRRGDGDPRPVLWEVEYFVVLGVLAVFVERLRRRFPLAGAPRRNLYLHVLASLCFTVLHPAGTAALVAIDNLFLRSGEGFRITFWPG